MKGSILILVCAVIYSVDACGSSKAKVSFDDALKSAKGKTDIQDLKDYLSENSNPDAETGFNGYNLMIFAAAYDNTEAVSLLLAAGADVNAKDNFGGTSLMAAAESGNADIMKILLQVENIDINIQDKDGSNALGWAKNDEVARLLRQQEGAVCQCSVRSGCWYSRRNHRDNPEELKNSC